MPVMEKQRRKATPAAIFGGGPARADSPESHSNILETREGIETLIRLLMGAFIVYKDGNTDDFWLLHMHIVIQIAE